MFKKVKKILGLNIIKWVDNTQKKYAHLESSRYLLVENRKLGPLLFTTSQITRARSRAEANQEDL